MIEFAEQIESLSNENSELKQAVSSLKAEIEEMRNSQVQGLAESAETKQRLASSIEAHHQAFVENKEVLSSQIPQLEEDNASVMQEAKPVSFRQ